MSSPQATATAEMAAFCLQVIASHLSRAPLPPCPSDITNDAFPIFVTLKTLPDDDLRGCIGNFAPQPLHDQLREYAMASAFQDSRFAPVTLDELPQLSCTISLLHSFEPCKAWNDWVVGVHGIRASFKHHSATYLPSVAAEQGWNHEETLKSLLAKGGYRGPVNAAVLGSVQVSRYQVSCATAKYTDI